MTEACRIHSQPRGARPYSRRQRDARLTLGTTTSIPSIYYLRCWLTPTDAVATPVLGRFAPATEITDELHAVIIGVVQHTQETTR